MPLSTLGCRIGTLGGRDGIIPQGHDLIVRGAQSLIEPGERTPEPKLRTPLLLSGLGEPVARLLPGSLVAIEDGSGTRTPTTRAQSFVSLK